MLTQALNALLLGKDLTVDEAREVGAKMFSGADSHQVAAFLTLLRAKGETADELLGVAQALREKIIPVKTSQPLLDIVGTGGDGFNTVNISTGSALLAAACGVTVAKHGNRSVSSRCGSADVLEALGVSVNQSPENVSRAIEKLGIGFMYAPNHHIIMKVLAPMRKKLKLRTIFNLLGPLLNPARAEYSLIGVCDSRVIPMMTRAAMALGIKRGFVFHGCGLDELSTVGRSEGLFFDKGVSQPLSVDPQALGFSLCRVEDLQGGDTAKNTSLLREALGGQRGAIFDALVLNGAMGLYLFGQAASLEQAVFKAKEVLASGTPLILLDQLKQFTQSVR